MVKLRFSRKLISIGLGFLVEGDTQENCKSFVENEIRPAIDESIDLFQLLLPRAQGKVSHKIDLCTTSHRNAKGITVGQVSDDSQLSREMMISK